MPTAEERAAALKASQEHWRENLAAETPDEASVRMKDCALCHLYHPIRRLPNTVNCVGCPIMESTGRSLCRGTSYASTVTALIEWDNDPDRSSRRKAFRREAAKMVNLLESLT